MNKPEKISKGSVLIVEDEDITRKIISEMISDMGYSVDTAINGKEAIDLYKENLGLTIVDKIISKFNGDIKAFNIADSSDIKKDTVTKVNFTISLPLVSR